MISRLNPLLELACIGLGVPNELQHQGAATRINLRFVTQFGNIGFNLQVLGPANLASKIAIPRVKKKERSQFLQLAMSFSFSF
jgi:hypothetical protein